MFIVCYRMELSKNWLGSERREWNEEKQNKMSGKKRIKWVERIENELFEMINDIQKIVLQLYVYYIALHCYELLWNWIGSNQMNQINEMKKSFKYMFVCFVCQAKLKLSNSWVNWVMWLSYDINLKIAMRNKKLQTLKLYYWFCFQIKREIKFSNYWDQHSKLIFFIN